MPYQVQSSPFRCAVIMSMQSEDDCGEEIARFTLDEEAQRTILRLVRYHSKSNVCLHTIGEIEYVGCDPASWHKAALPYSSMEDLHQLLPLALVVEVAAALLLLWSGISGPGQCCALVGICPLRSASRFARTWRPRCTDCSLVAARLFCACCGSTGSMLSSGLAIEGESRS